jgi:hypothetical protein
MRKTMLYTLYAGAVIVACVFLTPKNLSWRHEKEQDEVVVCQGVIIAFTTQIIPCASPSDLSFQIRFSDGTYETVTEVYPSMAAGDCITIFKRPNGTVYAK